MGVVPRNSFIAYLSANRRRSRFARRIGYDVGMKEDRADKFVRYLMMVVLALASFVMAVFISGFLFGFFFIGALGLIGQIYLGFYAASTAAFTYLLPWTERADKELLKVWPLIGILTIAIFTMLYRAMYCGPKLPRSKNFQN
jgi:small-conductance mechanosensitive channel